MASRAYVDALAWPSGSPAENKESPRNLLRGAGGDVELRCGE
jgi:hypothetical protein